MLQFPWLLLIVLVLSCSALGNGCSKAVRPPVQAAAAPHIQVICPLGYTTTSTRDLTPPNWVKEGVKRTTGVGTWMDDETLGSLAGATQIGAAAACAYVAYLPVAAAVGTIAGKSAGSKWRPCLKELAREIPEVDPAATLQRKLAKELNKFHEGQIVSLSPESNPFVTAVQQGMKSFLQADIEHIQIKQCQERGTFCLKVSLRARLWMVPEKSLYLDRVLVYTSYLPPKLEPSEIMVVGTYPCHTMEDYCGVAGKQRFREELTAAIDNLAQRLSLEMAL
jgi:hypothetical protein